MVKNEECIIEVFIRHHVKLFSHIFITDNNSTDNTVFIIESLIKEGLPITLWHDPTLAYEQSKITTQAYHRIASIMDFDLFFTLDADELLIIDKDFTLNSIDINNQCYLLNRYDYVLMNAEDSVLEMTRRFVNHHILGKTFICHNNNTFCNITINQGNHDICLNAKLVIPAQICSMWIAHFPYRGINHYLSKILLGSQAMMTKDPNFVTGESLEATHWYEEYQFILAHHCNITFQQYQNRIYRINAVEQLYNLTVEDPIIHINELKYSKLNSSRLIHSLAINYETMSKKYWELQNISKIQLISESIALFFKKKYLKLKRSIQKRVLIRS